jgi:hypothetical protein
MANKVLGMHRLKNKVNRNAFDLSHRHMFTAQVGELLPVFTQWVNPNETFKIGYNGKTRTASLNTDAFTRIRENIQYYFVPFQSLWKYFEQQVNNMTKGDSGQNISKFASSSIAASKISTSMPFISYRDLSNWLSTIYMYSVKALTAYFNLYKYEDCSAESFIDFCRTSSTFNHVFVCDGYRLCRAAKLLMALGYGNFSSIVRYDLFAQAMAFRSTGTHTWTQSSFLTSDYGLLLSDHAFANVSNSPNLSIFPLLAYHKICNDHYRNEKWQPFEPWTCNIDYLDPSSNMNAYSFIDASSLTSALTSIIDLENSNLPVDYFTSVLPRAQYGDESVAALSLGHASGTASVSGTTTSDDGRWSGDSLQSGDTIQVGYYLNYVDAKTSDGLKKFTHTHGISGKATIDTQLSGSLRISALRSATALQKYREIQNSNDPDFAAQVLAHFGIKPKVDSRTSVFIGGDDKVLSINPQVNTNFQDNGEPEIKAIGIGDLSAGCKFTSTTYGMIIGIYRAVPQLDYSRSGIDRNLFKSDATDFPIPELDSIGMQTQYRCEISAPLCGYSKSIDFTDLSSFSTNMASTYGYSPRYAELKSAYDYFEGGFCGAYSSWVTGYDEKFLSFWRHDLVSSGNSLLGIDDLFKCRPSLLYPIFVNQWSGTVNDDKLLIGSVNTCVAVRPFSMYGLPYSK